MLASCGIAVMLLCFATPEPASAQQLGRSLQRVAVNDVMVHASSPPFRDYNLAVVAQESLRAVLNDAPRDLLPTPYLEPLPPDINAAVLNEGRQARLERLHLRWASAPFVLHLHLDELTTDMPSAISFGVKDLTAHVTARWVLTQRELDGSETLIAEDTVSASNREAISRFLVFGRRKRFLRLAVATALNQAFATALEDARYRANFGERRFPKPIDLVDANDSP